MSASVGAICCIAKLEHPLHDLLYRSERIELPALHLVQEAPKLRIIRDGAIEMGLRAAGCNRKDLTGQILAPALLEPPVGLQISAMLLDLLPQLRHVLPGGRLGEDDRRFPGPVPVERQDGTHLV